MEIKVLNSGSSGNGYVLISNEEILLLECGVSAKDMMRAIDYQTNNVVGCLSTHSHGDHISNISHYMRYGFKVFTSEEVHSDIEAIYGEKTVAIIRMKKINLGDFLVIPFSVPHGETECDGFLIHHKEMGNLLFITDAEYCPYDFSKIGINHVLVECNYSKDYLTKDIANYGHVLQGHMELETCKRFIQTLNSQELRNIGLLHLSSGNADAGRFQREIKELVDCDVNVWVAEKGFQTVLSLDSF